RGARRSVPPIAFIGSLWFGQEQAVPLLPPALWTRKIGSPLDFLALWYDEENPHLGLAFFRAPFTKRRKDQRIGFRFHGTTHVLWSAANTDWPGRVPGERARFMREDVEVLFGSDDLYSGVIGDH